MTKLENALIWLYLKIWGKFGDHVIEEKDLWNFGADDLETVIKSVAYPGYGIPDTVSERIGSNRSSSSFD